jgi:hypothetical protein
MNSLLLLDHVDVIDVVLVPKSIPATLLQHNVYYAPLEHIPTIMSDACHVPQEKFLLLLEPLNAILATVVTNLTLQEFKDKVHVHNVYQVNSHQTVLDAYPVPQTTILQIPQLASVPPVDLVCK